MADFGKLSRQQVHAPQRRHVAPHTVPNSAVSEHMGQGKAMPQQGIVQNTARNADKSAADQSDLEAATTSQQPKQQAALNSGTDFRNVDVKKLTRAQRGELVDQVLNVRLCSQLLKAQQVPCHSDHFHGLCALISSSTSSASPAWSPVEAWP